MEEFQRAARLDPNDPAAHKSLANIYSEKGDYAAAAKECQTAVTLDPKDFAAQLNLSWSYYQQGQYDQSVSWNQKAMTIQPGHPAPRYNMALTYLRKGDYEKALEEYKKALQTDKNLEIIEYAIAALGSELSKEPTLRGGHFALGILYEGKGKKEEARQQFEMHVQKNPDGIWLKEAKEHLAELTKK